jgi:hypothetical protein
MNPSSPENLPQRRNLTTNMDPAVTDLQAEVNRLRHELQTLEVQHAAEDGEFITISDYILERLEQLEVKVCVPLQLYPLTLIPSSSPSLDCREISICVWFD